jgi:uncharacterized caspase-like protein
MQMKLRLVVCLLAIALASLGVAEARADRFVALVVGNSKYEKVSPLPNAQRDAAAVADRLRELGFDVTEVFDGDAFTLNRAAERFVSQARGADLALFYFAGHGIQLFDQNFLLARNVDPGQLSRVDDLGLDLTRFMTTLRNSGAVRQALLIDACRNNPFSFEETVRLVDLVRKAKAAEGKPAAPDQGDNRGLARVVLNQPDRQAQGAETLFFFAAQPGQVSFDGTGQNSFFVEALKEEFSKQGRPLGEMFRNVSAYVRTVTKGEQIPQVVSDWTADIVLGKSPASRVDYQVVALADNRTLSRTDHDLVLRSANGFGKFTGDFIAKAGVGDLPSGDMSEKERERARKLGHVQGFSIKYDLDRDGREETLRVFFQQTGYWLTIESQGVVGQVASCIDGDTPTAMEVALKDINGDRRPEVWVAYETEETSGWGKFCVLEFKGIPHLADRRRAATGQVNLGFSAFRTLLRGEAGWQVAVANDNTIKACGGSNCHSPWTYSFDGKAFRLIDNGGEAPSAAAAPPFADEKQRAANLHAGLSRSAAQLLASQNWSSARSGNNGMVVSARIGRRTEIRYQCSGNQSGTLGYEALEFHDKPAPNMQGGAEIEIDPTLVYGESGENAPMLLDGRRCGSISVTSEGGVIRVQTPDEPASACLQNLAQAKVVTLPLLHQKGLLTLRLDGGAQALSSARAVCQGRVASVAPAVAAPSPPLSSPSGNAATLDSRARAFVEDYMRRTEGETEQVLAFVRNSFGAEIRYYGKVVPNAQVVEEKRRYLARWPQRRYQLKPQTMRIQCDQGQATCVMSGELDYNVRDPRAARSASGAATYELRVVFTQAGPKVIEETGRSLARR